MTTNLRLFIAIVLSIIIWPLSTAFSQWERSSTFTLGPNKMISSFANAGGYIFAGLGSGSFISFTDSIVFRSGDGGESWENISAGIHPASAMTLKAWEDTLYLGLYDIFAVQNMYKSTDHGENWERISADFQYGEVFSILNYNQQVFAFTDPGGWIRSTDNGASWTQSIAGLDTLPSKPGAFNHFTYKGENFYVSTAKGVAYSSNNGDNWILPANSGLPAFVDGRITADNLFTIGDTLFLSGAHLSEGGFFISTNDGESWTFLSEDLRHLFPETLVRWQGSLFTGTDNISYNDSTTGVFRSDDNGDTWQSMNEGLPRLPQAFSQNINALQVAGNKLLTGIYGDALYNYSLDSSVTSISATSQIPEDFRLQPNFPNPFNGETTLAFELTTPQPISLTVYNTLGQIVMNRETGIFPAGQQYIRIDMNAQTTGIYFYHFRAGENFRTGKMLLLR